MKENALMQQKGVPSKWFVLARPNPVTHPRRLVLLLLCSLLPAFALADEHHAEVVVSTSQYSPTATLPGLAKQLKASGLHRPGGKPVAGTFVVAPINAVVVQQRKTPSKPTIKDAKNKPTGAPDPPQDPDFTKYAIYEKTAPRAATTEPSTTTLPLDLKPKSRIALIGNTLLERSGQFGQFEAMLHQKFPKHELVVRCLAWSADEIDVHPRPANFAGTQQHLTHERADVIFAAFGFNESFAGLEGLDTFRRKMTDYVASLATKAFNGQASPLIVLISPIANENIEGVAAADMNNGRPELYIAVMRDVAREQQIGFADVFNDT